MKLIFVIAIAACLLSSSAFANPAFTAEKECGQARSNQSVHSYSGTMVINGKNAAGAGTERYDCCGTITVQNRYSIPDVKPQTHTIMFSGITIDSFRSSIAKNEMGTA